MDEDKLFNAENKPDGFGLAFFRGRVEPFICNSCGGQVRFRDIYLYSFTPEGTIIMHNRQECWDSYVNTFS